jgi:CubicO group peptidase (beta-lactamase class C family)
MMRILAVLALIVGVTLPHHGAHAQTAAQVRSVDSLFSQYTKQPGPGVSIAVVRDGKVLLTKGYGLASLEHRVPITPSTVFDVASVSKQFTGLAVAMLVQQGRVKFTDDIRKYIPELGDVGHVVTIDHLLHHTSGYRDWPGTLALAGWRMDDVIAFDQILRMAYHQHSTNFVPGAEYTYSNTGYNLLAEMVSRVTGQSFRAWTDANLFKPLGMTHSHFRDEHNEMIPNRAFGYARDAGTWTFTTNELEALGSSSLFSTAEDLAKWVMNFDDPKVGGREAFNLTRTRGRLNNGDSIPYAFGISHGMYRGKRNMNHSGSWASFATFVVHFPDQHFGVVVLANSSINAGRAAYDLTDIFMGDELGPKPPAPNATATTVAVQPAVLDRYAGLYQLSPGWYLRVRRSGASLAVQASGENEVPMAPQSDSTFWVTSYNSPITFSLASGKVTLSYRGMRAPKVPDAPLTPASELKDFVGDYESGDLEMRYHVALTDSGLVMQHQRIGTISLKEVYRGDFRGSEWFTRSIQFLRDSSGKVTGLSVYVDERSRDIRFDRVR